MLKNFTIKTKLVFVLAFLAIQLILGAGLGLYSLKQTNEAMQSSFVNGIGALENLDTMVRKLIRIQAQVALAASAQSEQERTKYLDSIAEHSDIMHKAWDSYMTTQMTAEEKSLAEQFVVARNTFESEGLAPTITLLRDGKLEEGTAALHHKVVPLYTPVRKLTDQLIQMQVDDAKRDAQAARERYASVRNLYAGGVLVGLFVAIGVGIWLVRSIVTPLNKAVSVARDIAAGDLTVRIDTSAKDETGQMLSALQTMTDSLASIVRDVRNSTDTIATASAEIAAGNMDLSNRTEQQAANLEETASSMEEITSTVKQNAENAEQGNRLAATASETAKKGGEAVTAVVETMSKINQSSHKIAEITGVIDSLAFQTNLLALNAAVEAARAGEQGRGFAVVASEVRALAQRSAEAAREIKALIAASASQVEDGSKQVEQAGATMTEIVHRISQVHDIMEEITLASREQTLGIEQVNKAVAQMDQVTQQNAALVEEAAAAAASMQEEAQQLTRVVGVFKV